MKKLFITICIAAMAMCLSNAQGLKPWEKSGWETGEYRNVFAEMGYTQDEIDRRVQDAFDGIFFGPNKVYFEVEDSLAYMSDIKNHDARTEGLSYGMMIAVQFDRKDIFDKLWRWTKKYMQNQDGVWKGYFAWSCKVDGTKNAIGPASDGELYFITSLLFASNRWGNDTGINYLAEAQNILEIIQPREVEMPVRRAPWQPQDPDAPKTVKQTLALMDPETKIITFVPGQKYTDPSYHLPVFYEIWAKYGQDGRSDYWMECARLSREYLHKSIDKNTGLNPDTNNFDGTPQTGGWMGAPAFRYDSWRVPMNIALDYSWACKDKEWQQWYGKTIQNFLYKEGIDDFVDQYNVDGTRPERIMQAGGYQVLRHSVGFVATAAAASLLTEHEINREFVDRLWNSTHEPYEDGYFDAYYDGLLRLFAFMHLSGRYRVIDKK